MRVKGRHFFLLIISTYLPSGQCLHPPLPSKFFIKISEKAPHALLRPSLRCQELKHISVLESCDEWRQN